MKESNIFKKAKVIHFAKPLKCGISATVTYMSHVTYTSI